MNWSLIYSYQIGDGSAFRAFAESLAQIELAESYGCDAVLISEHHFVDNGYFPAPFIAMSAIAARTRKIRIGSGIIILPLYDPVHVAEHGAVLDIISGGRLILGVGQGYRQEEFEGFGIPLSSRPERLKEGCSLIRALWTQDAVSYEGKHFKVRNLELRPQPTQKPHPPIWVAAKSKAAVELAAEVGDVWFADPVTSLQTLKERMGDYRARLRQCGKPFDNVQLPLMREAYCANTDEEAWKEACEPVLYVYREYLKWGHMQDDQGQPIAPGDNRALDLLRKRFIIGSPETCIRECCRYRDELGATNLVLRMRFPGLPHDRVMNSIRLWAEKVIPYV
jgi:probable F420-dependent oxidoreductase